MLGLQKIAQCLCVLSTLLATTQAVPTGNLFTDRRSLAARKAAKSAQLSDPDILEFALTLEHLEAAFYAEGLKKFPKSDFKKLGLSNKQFKDLETVAADEAVHESFIEGALAAQGIKPVEPCKYDFKFTTAKNMVATARTLEAVGVSAYLGAAPLVSDPNILTAAATIATTESRHQTLIRTLQKADAVPTAFDTPLGPRGVFSIASQFIKSCPSGSNLNIQPFNAIALQGADKLKPGQKLNIGKGAKNAGANFCTYINQNNQFFEKVNNNGDCLVAQNIAGEAYLLLTKDKSIDDNQVVAGPTVLTIS